MTSIRAVVGTVLVLGVSLYVGLPSAGARQEGPYVPGGPVFGDLVIEGDSLMIGATVRLVGEGFGPNSTIVASVRANASGEVVVEMDDSANRNGRARVRIDLVDPIRAGGYTASLLGVTADGATVELTGGLMVQAIPEPTATPTPVGDRSPVVERPTPAPAQQNPPPTPRSPAARTPLPAPTALIVPTAPPTATEVPEVQGATVQATATAGTAGTDGDDGTETGSETATVEADDASAEDDATGDDAAATDAGTDDSSNSDEVAAGPAVGDDDGSGGALTWVGISAAAVLLLGGGAVLYQRRSRTTTP